MITDMIPGEMDTLLLRRQVPPFDLFFRVVGRCLDGRAYTREVHDQESLIEAENEVRRAVELLGS
jgi:hypothetical protein